MLQSSQELVAGLPGCQLSGQETSLLTAADILFPQSIYILSHPVYMEDLRHLGANLAKWKLLWSISFVAPCCRACPKAAVLAALPHVDGFTALPVFPKSLKSDMKVVPLYVIRGTKHRQFECSFVCLPSRPALPLPLAHRPSEHSKMHNLVKL